MIRYLFDLYPRDDPRDGARLVRFSKLQPGASYRAERFSPGYGQFSIRSDTTDASFIDPRGLQYVRVVEEDTVEETETVRGGFFLENGTFAALNARRTRRLTFGGQGPLGYLARARMWSRSYYLYGDSLEDPTDGLWYLYRQAAEEGGDFLGSVLYRVLTEAQSLPAGAPDPDRDRLEVAIPAAVVAFGRFNDSAANPWTIPSGLFTAQVGESVLSVVQRIMAAGLLVFVHPDTFDVWAWERGTVEAIGQDKTGPAWANDVVRFQSPTDPLDLATGNIFTDMNVGVAAFAPRKRVLAGGPNGYLAVSGAADLPWEGFVPSEVGNDETLESIATTELDRRTDAAQTPRIRFPIGNDPAIGHYLPFKFIEGDGKAGIVPADFVTVDTGAGQWDFDDDSFPVGAVTVALRKGGDWTAVADLGATYTSMAERAAQARGVGPHPHPPNPQLCSDGIATAFSSPLELLMRFRFRMAVTTQRHSLEMILKDNTGATQLQWVINNAAGAGFSNQMGVASLDLDDSAANTTDGPATSAILVTVDDVWCFCRLRVDSGGQAQIRLWKDGDAEPGTWDVETDDAAVDVDGSVPLLNRFDAQPIAGSAASGSSIEIDYIQFVSGFAGLSSTESFNRTVASGAGTANWNGVAYDGRTANLSVDGSVLIDSNGDPSGGLWGLNIPTGTDTCTHGGPNATGGDATVTCGKCAARGNHEHDYVPSGGATGQVPAKASDADWDLEWVDLPGIGGSFFVSQAKWMTD